MTSTIEKCTLHPINLHNPTEFTELQRQRHKCGWLYDNAALETWRSKQDARLKSFFWIIIPSNTGPDHIRAGHISLDSYTDPPDLELASSDRSALTIQTFFILPEYRGDGLGRKAMDLVEALATQEPYGSRECEYVTMTSMSKKYYYSEEVEWRGIWERLVRERPVVCPVDWYERRGYVRWKSEPRFREVDVDGEEVVIVADFLRRALT
ncbi:hypothetical protein BDV25DRAFT_169432 [Aspergillus avenaceus]|uniref:N-acetyltransferase domain-containing protein n=1 Tax=Aspergillus avenaceus TaxID=36643 RepID=A0A5N6TLS3_ASPAV|nr:hypothetical protein BDV25DRAFT_169432 [Aspergillus avenaceus]